MTIKAAVAIQERCEGLKGLRFRRIERVGDRDGDDYAVTIWADEPGTGIFATANYAKASAIIHEHVRELTEGVDDPE